MASALRPLPPEDWPSIDHLVTEDGASRMAYSAKIRVGCCGRDDNAGYRSRLVKLGVARVRIR
jgi:hypothetical protein